MDALAILKKDHRTVEALFRRYEVGSRAKRRLCDEIIQELAVHTRIEDGVFYPAARKAMGADAFLVFKAIEEHRVMEILLGELVGLSATDERFDAKVAVLIELTRAHLEIEENELFPAVRNYVPAARLQALAQELQSARKRAPTRPIARTPEAAAGVVKAPVIAAMERGREMLRTFSEGNSGHQPSRRKATPRHPHA